MFKVPLHRTSEEHPADVTRVQLAIINAGFSCGREDAQRVWQNVSKARDVGWLPVETMNEAEIRSFALDAIDLVP